VEYKYRDNDWARSANFSTCGTFSTLEAAEKAAQKEQQKMGNLYVYRAAHLRRAVPVTPIPAQSGYRVTMAISKTQPEPKKGSFIVEFKNGDNWIRSGNEATHGEFSTLEAAQEAAQKEEQRANDRYGARRYFYRAVPKP
jgi:hypothetical protein